MVCGSEFELNQVTKFDKEINIETSNQTILSH